MFFLSFGNSSIIFEDIAEHLLYVNLPIYILANCLGADIFYNVLCKINNGETIFKFPKKLKYKKSK